MLSRNCNNNDDEVAEVTKQRLKPKILKYRRYNQLNDPINYYREQVLLFYPWRDEAKEIKAKIVKIFLRKIKK